MLKAAMAVAILSLAAGAAPARASGTGEFILGDNMLPPLAHTMFCQKYPQECLKSEATTSHLIADQKDLLAQLESVNQTINEAIWPLRVKARGGRYYQWVLFPATGTCNDYVVSKRHELMARGWPSSGLLIAEVVLNTGEHHLVLVANAGGSTYILDNLGPEVVPLTSSVGYHWIRIQSPQDPEMWVSMGPHK